MVSRSVRLAAAAAAAGALLTAATGPASAWPIPLTSDDIRFLNTARGTFPGDDDELLQAGKYMCHLLYSGQPSAAVIDQVGAEHGASHDQAAKLMGAARGSLCRMAPG